MRKLIMYCDRCHKEFEKWNHKHDEKIGVAELVYDDGYDPYLDNQLDLCESCYKELEKWWDCEKEEKETCCKDTNDPTTDTISRQAVLEIAKSSKSNWIDNSVLFKRVNELSPITLQQNTGHWIALGNYDDYGCESSYKCSECGELNTYPDNYCPNCGAKMILPQESEE